MLKRYDRTKLIQPSDWPNYVEKIRPIYEPEEIQTLLRHANDDEAIFLKFMVGSGFRDRETQSVTWRDIDFHNVRVSRYDEAYLGIQAKELGREVRALANCADPATQRGERATQRTASATTFSEFQGET